MTLQRQLNTLESAGLVSIAQFEPDLEYLFRHALVREAAYTSILSADQKELHLAVGEAIELLYPERIDEYAAMLSYHFGEAGDEQKAQKYCVIAGENALASFANREAEYHFCCALDLVNQKSDRADLLYLLGEARFRQSRYEEAIQTWKLGLELYSQLEDLSGVARLFARAARAAWYFGDHPEGLRLSLEGWQAAEDMQELPAKAMLLHELSRAYHFNGYPEEAEPLCREALEMAERLGAVDTQADALTTLGVLPNVSGEDSLAYLAKAVELAESNGLMEIASRANHNLGVMTAEHTGNQKAAREYYLRGAELAKQRGAAQEELFSLTSAAGTSLGMGDLSTARETVERIDEIRSTFLDPNQAQFEYAGIEIGLKYLSGELQEALEIIHNVRAEARERGDLQMLHNYCITYVDVVYVLDKIDRVADWSDAEQAAKEGIETSRRITGRSIQSHRHLATIYLRQMRLEEAKQVYAEAKQIAGALPRFWQKQSLLGIERELARAEGDWGTALDAAEKLSKQLVQTGMRWPWANSLVEWAETHEARGEPLDYERAWTLYREAMAVFEDMGTPFYVNVLEGRMRDLRAKTVAVTVAHDEVTHELEEAGKIQGSFLPEEIPSVPGWEISAILQPARETSGDFFDFINIPGNKLGMIVADVADKGIGAALYMTTCRTLIRTYAGEHPDAPELVLAKTNTRILADTHGGLFITVFYAVLDPESGKMKYCNAGHNPPFVFSPDQADAHLQLTRTGMPLGILADETWEKGEITFKEGSLLVGYTDGITENQNEEEQFFGEERLAFLIKENQTLPAKTLQDKLLENVKDFSGALPQFDDMTLLVIKRV